MYMYHTYYITLHMYIRAWNFYAKHKPACATWYSICTQLWKGMNWHFIEPLFFSTSIHISMYSYSLYLSRKSLNIGIYEKEDRKKKKKKSQPLKIYLLVHVHVHTWYPVSVLVRWELEHKVAEPFLEQDASLGQCRRGPPPLRYAPESSP